MKWKISFLVIVVIVSFSVGTHAYANEESFEGGIGGAEFFNSSTTSLLRNS
jgi:hypothetical protein